MLTHVFFSGSHIWGFCYIGIIKYIQSFPDKFKFVKDFGGVSFGASISLLLALNVPINIIKEHFYKYSEDNSLKINEIDNIINIINHKGMEDSSKYFVFLKSYLIETYGVEDFTFLELSKKFGNNLHVTALCTNTGEIELFNVDRTPHVNIIEATIASISIPIVSMPVMINNKYYSDPALLNNTILDFFKHIPKNQILSVINKLEVKFDKNIENMNTLKYFYNLLLCYNKRQYDLVCLSYINDYTLVIKDHDDFINIIINENGIIQDFNKETIDICILHGFNSISKWFIK